MGYDYGTLLPIVLGIVVIFIVFLKKKKLGLPKVCYLFLIGSTAYGGIASLYLGLTGNFMFTDTIDSYRLWITLAGLVLLWIVWDVLRKEMK